MRVGFQAAVFAVLVGVAIVYFALPARAQAQDNCRAWVTEMQDDEGGPVLMTHVCSDDSSQTWLAMTCHDGKLWIDHDLALGGSKEPASGETAEVEFVTDGGIETVPMMFQEMNAMFGGEAPADGKLVALLKSQASLLIRDKGAAYPARTYGLKGSSAALTRLVSECR
jgi:hypothetical protein